MRMRSGKIRSLIAGIAILAIAAAGFCLIPGPTIAGGMPGSGTTLNLFKIAWIAVGLVGVGLAFYNAFSRQPKVPYEIDDDVYTIDNQMGHVCPKCGKPVGESDRFCRNCGAYLRA